VYFDRGGIEIGPVGAFDGSTGRVEAVSVLVDHVAVLEHQIDDVVTGIIAEAVGEDEHGIGGDGLPAAVVVGIGHPPDSDPNLTDVILRAVPNEGHAARRQRKERGALDVSRRISEPVPPKAHGVDTDVALSIKIEKLDVHNVVVHVASEIVGDLKRYPTYGCPSAVEGGPAVNHVLRTGTRDGRKRKDRQSKDCCNAALLKSHREPLSGR